MGIAGSPLRRLDRYFFAAVIVIIVLNTPVWFQWVYQPPLVANTVTIYSDTTVPLGTSTGVGVARNLVNGFPVNDTWPGLVALNRDLNVAIADSKNAIAIQVNKTVTLGSKVAVVPYVISGGQRITAMDSAYLVFLVDPQGIVRFSYPSGDTPMNYVYGYPTLSNDLRAAMARGTIAFTHEIPTELTSIGLWTVMVLLIDYYGVGVPAASIRGEAKTSFTVVEPKTHPSMLEFFREFMLTWVAPVLMVWGLLSICEVRKALRLLFKNLLFLLGLGILILFFILGYFVS